MRRINIYVDESLWREFRKHCLAMDISASKRITELVAQVLKDHQERAGSRSQTPRETPSAR